MMELAVEMSTDVCSLALRVKDGPCESASWTLRRREPEPLYERLEALRKSLNRPWSDLSLALCGIGPGRYSGMRTAVSVATGLCLVSNTPRFGISSGWALAYKMLREQDGDEAIVVGDARRQAWWYGALARTDSDLAVRQPWALETPQRVLDQLNTGRALIGTSEWDRCGAVLQDIREGEGRMQSDSIYPTATDLFALYDAVDPDSAFIQPAQPIYLHPAV